MIITNQ